MDLILIACLLSAPADCREDRIALSEDAPPLVCILRAQVFLAEWRAAHPKYRVERWRCVPAGANPDGGRA